MQLTLFGYPTYVPVLAVGGATGRQRISKKMSRNWFGESPETESSIAVGMEPSHAISDSELSISYRVKPTMSKSVKPSDLYACTTAGDFDQNWVLAQFARYFRPNIFVRSL